MDTNKLPFHPIPYEGESLTSYIQRISELNRIKPHDFWRLVNIKGKHYPQTSYANILNYVPTTSIYMDKLATFTGLSVKILII